MSKGKDAEDAAKEYARHMRRDWHETQPRSPKSVRKLEGTDRKNKK